MIKTVLAIIGVLTIIALILIYLFLRFCWTGLRYSRMTEPQLPRPRPTEERWLRLLPTVF